MLNKKYIVRCYFNSTIHKLFGLVVNSRIAQCCSKNTKFGNNTVSSIVCSIRRFFMNKINIYEMKHTCIKIS